MPVSNIVAHPGAPMADRWLYQASAFFALFLCRLTLLLFNKKETFIPLTAVFFTLFLSVFTVQRNGVFRNNFLLYSEALKAFPNSAIMQNNLGNEHEKMGNEKEAERLYILALKNDPNGHLSYANLAAIYVKRNEYEKAFSLFKKAYELKPTDSFTAIALGFFTKKGGT